VTGDDDKIVSLDAHRIRTVGEFSDEQVAYVEALWGKETWAFNIAIRDLEAMRRGSGEKELRPPQTYHEVQQVILQVRALANEIARFYGFEELARKGDDVGFK